MLIHNFLTFADHGVCETLGEEEEEEENGGGKCQKTKKNETNKQKSSRSRFAFVGK